MKLLSALHFVACGLCAVLTPWLSLLYIRFAVEEWRMLGQEPPVTLILLGAFCFGACGPLALLLRFYQDRQNALMKQ